MESKNRNIQSRDFQILRPLLRRLKSHKNERGFLLGQLEKLYESVGTSARYHIVLEIIETGDKRILDFLGKILLTDKSELIRHEVAFGIGAIGDKKYQTLLIQAMTQDPAPIVRHEAAVALATVGDDQSLKPLRAIINKAHEDKAVVASAQYSLDVLLQKKEII